jgi:hypothetical protein
MWIINEDRTVIHEFLEKSLPDAKPTSSHSLLAITLHTYTIVELNSDEGTDFKKSGLMSNKVVHSRERRSRDSVVGIATGYGLDDRGVGVRVTVGSTIFSSSRRPDRPPGPSQPIQWSPWVFPADKAA